jgi:uncharacterized protein YcfJ
VSNNIIGMGVMVVAGFAASAAVTAYVMRAPGAVPSTVSPVAEPAPVSLRPAAVDPLQRVDLPKSDVPDPDELAVARHSVIGIRLDYAVSSRSAKLADRISATVSRNVTVDERVAIPEGARLEGTITGVDRGGQFRERPRLSLQFDTMILTDGTRMSIKTEAIVREGDSSPVDAAGKVGAGTAAGAILGSVLGGNKGAVIGGVTGTAAGTSTVITGEGDETVFNAGAPLTVQLTDELIILVRKQQEGLEL